jgi:hypothetical protein
LGILIGVYSGWAAGRRIPYLGQKLAAGGIPMKIVRPEELTSFPEIRELTPEELAEAYRLAREAFTAEDLQSFTEIGPEVPFEDVLAELEEQEKQLNQKAT